MYVGPEYPEQRYRFNEADTKEETAINMRTKECFESLKSSGPIDYIINGVESNRWTEVGGDIVIDIMLKNGKISNLIAEDVDYVRPVSNW